MILLYIVYKDAIKKLHYASANLNSTGQPFFLNVGIKRPHLVGRKGVQGVCNCQQFLCWAHTPRDGLCSVSCHRQHFLVHCVFAVYSCENVNELNACKGRHTYSDAVCPSVWRPSILLMSRWMDICLCSREMCFAQWDTSLLIIIAHCRISTDYHPYTQSSHLCDCHRVNASFVYSDMIDDGWLAEWSL